MIYTGKTSKIAKLVFKFDFLYFRVWFYGKYQNKRISNWIKNVSPHNYIRSISPKHKFDDIILFYKMWLKGVFRINERSVIQ